MLITVLLIVLWNVAILSSLHNLKKVWLLQITKMRNQKLEKIKYDNQNEDLVATKNIMELTYFEFQNCYSCIFL